MIENVSREPLYEGMEEEENVLSLSASDTDAMAAVDVEKLLNTMPNRRYACVLRQLLLNEVAPERLAQEMNITVDNLYNIKRRAMQQLMRGALTDICQYGKR